MTFDAKKAAAAADQVLAKLRATHGAQNVDHLKTPALSILKNGQVTSVDAGVYAIVMPGSGEQLLVEPGRCECPAFQGGTRVCSHTVAARIRAALDPAPASTPAPEPTETLPATVEATPHPSMPDDMTSAVAVQATINRLPQGISGAVVPRIAELIPRLPRDITEDAFQSAVFWELAALHDEGRLAKVKPASVVKAVAKAATQGFLPGRDCYFVVPTGDTLECWDGYKGLQRQLARLSQIRDSFAEAVHSQDHFEHDLLSGSPPSHRVKLNEKSRGPIIAYYGVVIFKDGYKRLKVMSLEEIEKVKQLSPTKDKTWSPWNKHPVSMAKVAVLRRLCRSIVQIDEQLFVGDGMDAEEDEAYLAPPGEERMREITSDMWGGPRPDVGVK